MDRSYLLERARRARGLTQARLASLSGTSQATLSAYERGLKSPSVGPPACFATLHIPDEIRNTGMCTWNMRDREERRGVYEQLIRRGLPQQMIRWIDGGLLIDVWDQLDLPNPVRDAWEPAIRLATTPLDVDGLRGSRFDPRP